MCTQVLYLSSCIPQNDSTVQFEFLDAGGVAGTIVICLVVVIVAVVMIVLVVFGVYKYRTRNNKSSVDSECFLATA